MFYTRAEIKEIPVLENLKQKRDKCKQRGVRRAKYIYIYIYTLESS